MVGATLIIGEDIITTLITMDIMDITIITIAMLIIEEEVILDITQETLEEDHHQVFLTEEELILDLK